MLTRVLRTRTNLGGAFVLWFAALFSSGLCPPARAVDPDVIAPIVVAPWARAIPPTTAATETVVARVNGAEITRQMVQEVVRGVMIERPGPPSSREIQEVTDAALESLIDLELLYQEALARNLMVRSTDIDAEMRRDRARFATDADFDAALEARGLTEAQLRQDTRKTRLADLLLTETTRKGVPVANAEVRAFYDQHPEEFDRPDRARVRHIVFGFPSDASVTERISARGAAERVRTEILDGADFAALARQYSTDGASAQAGGELGLVERRQLRPKADAAAFSLPVRGVSEAIENRDGYEILQVTERQRAGKVQFSEVEESISRALTEAKQQELQRAYVAQLRREAKIERISQSQLAGDD